MEFLLGHGETIGYEELHGIGGVLEQERELLLLGRTEVLEHEVGGVLATGRPSHAHADAVEVLGAEGPGDVAEAVVAALAAAEFRRTVLKGMSSSSCTAITWSAVTSWKRARAPTGPPLRFM